MHLFTLLHEQYVYTAMSWGSKIHSVSLKDVMEGRKPHLIILQETIHCTNCIKVVIFAMNKFL